MTPTTIRFIIILILLVCTLGGLLFMAKKLHTQSLALSDALETLASDASVERAFTSLSEVLTNSAAEREEIESYVVSGEQGTIEFLTTVESLAEQYRIELNGTALNTATSDTFKTPIIVVTFAFTGPRTLAESYLLALEKLPYASYVEEVSISVLENDTGGEQLQGNVTLHVAVRNIDV